jgi:WS/DGAT/MGAT family acyltransferase
VTDRLSALDVSFFYLETPTTAMHVGEVAIFAPPAGEPFEVGALRRLVERRIAEVPRYRQKVRWVPARLANPVWVDDDDFDLGYHVRRSALPRPGSIEQLRELVGRVQSRQLDRTRPLWEIYLVEGLADGRFAVITKTHHAMADGGGTLDIGSLLLDDTPTPREPPPDRWQPARAPGALELMAAAVADNLRRPSEIVETLRGSVTDARATTGRALGAVTGALATVRTSLRPAPATALNVPLGEQRRYGTAATALEDYKRVRQTHGGTVNDVVLATVAGALRTWLLTRGESVTAATTLRAMVPVSIQDPDDAGESDPRTPPGSRVSAVFVELPVGESSPRVRLHRVSYQMKAHKDSGRSVGADALQSLSGFAPPTIHAAAARLGARMARRLFNVVVTNVPGPQFALYAAGAQMLECYPVVPLAKEQALTVGLTSYDGGVFYGLNADRDAMPDVDVLALCLEESLAELLETVP